MNVDRAAELARDLPVRASVVTLGAAGALVVADEVTHVPAPDVVPVDTTAARRFRSAGRSPTRSWEEVR